MQKLNVRFGLRGQPVDTTQALNLSAGVSNSNVSRGRSYQIKTAPEGAAIACLYIQLCFFATSEAD